MHRTAIAATLAALGLASAVACAPCASAAPQAAPAVHGKPKAPVSIDARLADGAGRVTVRFEAEARDVRVEVRGSEGLAVTSAPAPVEGASFSRGDVASFDVAYTPGPGRSFLSVAVSGKFRGAGKRSSVTSFALGEPTPEQLRGTGTVVEGSGGDRVKVVVPGN